MLTGDGLGLGLGPRSSQVMVTEQCRVTGASRFRPPAHRYLHTDSDCDQSGSECAKLSVSDCCSSAFQIVWYP